VFYILAIVGISYGALYSLGDLGKLLNSFYPTYILAISGIMALAAAINSDATRLLMARMYFTYISLLISLLVVNIVLADYEKEDDDIHADSRTNWIALDTDTKRNLQEDYACCGWETSTDNAVLPCASGLDGCKSPLSEKLNDRIDTINSFMGWTIAAEVVALIWALLYAKTMIYRYKKWLKKKEDDDTRAKDVEKVALLRSSEILRGRSFLEEEEEEP